MFPIVKPDLILLDVMLPGGWTARGRPAASELPLMCRLSCSPPNQSTLDVVAAWKPGPTTTCPSPSKWPNCWRVSVHASASPSRPPKTVPPVAQAVGNANVNHLERGPIVIDRLEHTATKDGKDLNLTPMEIRAAVHARGRRRRGHQSFQPAQECLGIREFRRDAPGRRACSTP